MLIHTLKELNRAIDSKRAVVLISHLGSGKQTLLFADDSTHDNELSTQQREIAKESLRSGLCKIIKENNEELFFQPFNPPLRMIIIGAVHIAKSLISLARLCYYQVTVIDPRNAFADEARFPDVNILTDWPDRALEIIKPDYRTAIVTLTHDPKLDDPALSAALKTDAFYIGALGSRKTQKDRQQRLIQHGSSIEQQSRIFGPVGLDIGAKSPEEIAISIMAQVTESLHKT